MIRLTTRSAVLVLLLLAVVAGGCSRGEPTGPVLRPEGLRVGAVAQAVWSPVSFQRGVYGRWIGAEGGTLHFGGGSLSFPAGALDRTTLITAMVDGQRLAVDFGPAGLQFAPDAKPVLSFSFGTTQFDGRRLQIAYVDEESRVLSVLPTMVFGSGVATAPLDHFSPYILAQN